MISSSTTCYYDTTPFYIILVYLWVMCLGWDKFRIILLKVKTQTLLLGRGILKRFSISQLKNPGHGCNPALRFCSIKNIWVILMVLWISRIISSIANWLPVLHVGMLGGPWGSRNWAVMGHMHKNIWPPTISNTETRIKFYLWVLCPNWWQ